MKLMKLIRRISYFGLLITQPYQTCTEKDKIVLIMSFRIFTLCGFVQSYEVMFN
jgi:hypothetical protein